MEHTRLLQVYVLFMLTLAIVLGAALYALEGAGPAQEYRRTPVCPEDTVIVGIGDFEHGRWTAYECGPSTDDYYG